MALDKIQADVLAQKIIINMAESGSLKTVGPTYGGGVDETTNARRGTYDAVYISTLYRDLVSELQK